MREFIFVAMVGLLFLNSVQGQTQKDQMKMSENYEQENLESLSVHQLEQSE